LKGEFELSVQRSQVLSEVPKVEKSSFIKEKIGGRISRSLGVGASEGLLGENKSLCEVMKS
jgi:hypothetical protein